MRIMHFTVDEKFIPFIQTVYHDAFPGMNEYRVLGYQSRGLKFVSPGENVKIPKSSYWCSDELHQELVDFDCLVIHYLTPEFIQALKHVPKNIFVFWSAWGGDYECLFEPLLGNFILPETAKVSQLESAVERLYPYMKSPQVLFGIVLERLKRKFNKTDNWQSDSKAILSIANRFDVISVTPGEEALMKKALSRDDVKFHMVPYYSTETVFSKGPEKMMGEDILVGNSASPTNNHIEAFNALRDSKLNGGKIITPLSYGSKKYAKKIIEYGKYCFGEKFLALTDFISIDSYNQMVSTCGFVVMNHIRQQAVGNIFNAIYKGAKVYLRNENPLHIFCDQLGVSVETINNYGPIELSPLTAEAQEMNHRIVADYWLYANVVEKARLLELFKNKR